MARRRYDYPLPNPALPNRATAQNLSKDMASAIENFIASRGIKKAEPSLLEQLIENLGRSGYPVARAKTQFIVNGKTHCVGIEALKTFAQQKGVAIPNGL